MRSESGFRERPCRGRCRAWMCGGIVPLQRFLRAPVNARECEIERGFPRCCDRVMQRRHERVRALRSRSQRAADHGEIGGRDRAAERCGATAVGAGVTARDVSTLVASSASTSGEDAVTPRLTGLRACMRGAASPRLTLLRAPVCAASGSGARAPPTRSRVAWDQVSADAP